MVTLFFCDDGLEGLDVERLLGDDLLESTIFLFERFQPVHLAQHHAAVLRFPPVVRLLGDSVHATEIRDFPSGFAFFDDRQDLLVGEFAPLHRTSSEIGGPSFYAWRIIGGRSELLLVANPDEDECYHHKRTGAAPTKGR